MAMKIVFMGTPDFAVPSLQKLLDNGYTVAAVVTTPDKERGRGQKISFTPVKEFALHNGIEVLQPVTLKDESFILRLKEINADIFVVVAFRILPSEVYSLPRLGAFNLHGSLLPKYRGAAPIQWAIIKGEQETGVTTFFLQDKVDTGNIILSEKIQILPEDDFGSLHDKMSLVGAQAVLDTIKLIEKGNVKVISQDNQLATPAPKIKKETCLIDWSNSAEEIQNLVRGLSPYPAAFFVHNKKAYKIFKSSVINRSELKPGEIAQSKTEVQIGTASGALNILELQPEGRKRMSAEAFLRGYSLI